MNDEQVMHALSIDDVYDVERVLARGKTGTTELVTAKGAGPFVRKKMARELVRRGVWSALLDCDCPRLPRIEATCQMPDEFAVVYDFIPGENLQELMGERGRLPEDEAVALTLDICEAASAIHVLGVIHRDITPKNVIVSGDGAHLIDFGIARMYTEGASRDTNTLGTFGFASPEQYGFEQTDARSDVYSIGRVLGYLLTGVMPNDESYREVLADESAVSARMRAIVERACAMEPSARYQSAADFAAALRGEKIVEAVRRVATADVRSSEVPVAGRTSRRPKWNVVLAEVICALTAVAIILILLARNGVIPQWSATDGGSVPTWGGYYKSSADASASGDASSDAAAGSYSDDATFDDIVVVDNVSWRVSGSLLEVTYSVTNTSDDKLVLSVPTTVSARDADGKVIGTSSGIPTRLFPGQTIWDEVAVSDGASAVAATVTARPIEDYALVSASADDASAFEVFNTSCKTKLGGALSVTGEVTCQKKSRFAQGKIGLAVLLKDAAGDVVASQIVMADYPGDGEPAPFEAYILNVPEYETYEIHAFDM